MSEAAHHIQIIHHPQARYRTRIHVVHLHYRHTVKRVLKLSASLARRWGLPRRLELVPLDPAEPSCELRHVSEADLVRIASQHSQASRNSAARPAQASECETRSPRTRRSVGRRRARHGETY
jgi:HD-like signal output (HDOD) protein